MSENSHLALRPNWGDVAVGVIFAALGGFFAGDALLHLPLGDPLRMGPGFYPFGLGLCLMGLGVAIGIKGFIDKVETAPARPIPWRAIAILVPLPIFFGLAIRGLGLVPTVFIMAFAASFASKKVRPGGAVVLAAGLTIFCVFVFNVIAGLPTPLFGSWLGPVNSAWIRFVGGFG